MESSILRILKVGITYITETLSIVHKYSMRGPEAAERLPFLFNAFPEDTTDEPTKFLQPNLVGPRTLWEQVGWAYRHPNQLTQVQKDSLIPLQYYALDALANLAAGCISGSEKWVLTRVKGNAGRLLQEYDSYNARILDPDLPEWKLPVGKITTKTATALAAVAFALSACGPVSTPKPIEASPTKPAATLPIQTETKIPTVTRTPTESMTPTETSVPRPVYASSAETVDQMTLVESLAPIVQDVLAHPTLPQEVTLDFDPIVTFDQPGFTGVFIDCQMGTNCNARAFVRVADPVNGPDRLYIIWEVRNPGYERSKVLITYIGANGGNINGNHAQDTLDGVNTSIQNHYRARLTVITRRKRSSFYNPVLVEMYDQMSEEDRKEVDKLEKDYSISDELSHIPLWIMDIY